MKSLDDDKIKVIAGIGSSGSRYYSIEKYLIAFQEKLGWQIEVAIMSLSDMYIGNFTGACDAAAAMHLPSIVISRDSKDKPIKYAATWEYYANFPWQTETIVIRPDHPLEECVKFLNRFSFSTCGFPSHCINQIEPQEIVNAYEKMVDFIRTAKKVGGFPILQNLKSIVASNTLNKFKRQKNFEIPQTYRLVEKEDYWKIESDSDNKYSFIKEGNYWTIR